MTLGNGGGGGGGGGWMNTVNARMELLDSHSN